jgi:hypothetical protein
MIQNMYGLEKSILLFVESEVCNLRVRNFFCNESNNKYIIFERKNLGKRSYIPAIQIIIHTEYYCNYCYNKWQKLSIMTSLLLIISKWIVYLKNNRIEVLMKICDH